MDTTGKNKSEKTESSKAPVDYTLLNQELDKLGHSLTDKIYYKLLMRYMKKNLPFERYDLVLWRGGLYTIPTWIGYVIFATLFGWFFVRTYDKYGIGRLVAYVSILILWRVNVAIKTLNEVNKNQKTLIKKFS